MNFLVGLFFSILGTVISGAFGMAAWNVCIPAIFVGAPEITLVQAVAIAMVLNIMTYDGGTTSEDKADAEKLVEVVINKLIRIIVVSALFLGVLWLIMQF